jgi:hypothetical protein
VHEEAEAAREQANRDRVPVGARGGDLGGEEEVEEGRSEDLKEGNVLVEVAAPAVLLQAGLDARADGDEELVVRQRELE